MQEVLVRLQAYNEECAKIKKYCTPNLFDVVIEKNTKGSSIAVRKIMDVATERNIIVPK